MFGLRGRRRRNRSVWVTASLALVPVILFLAGAELYAEFARARELRLELNRSYDARSQIQSVFSLMQDAETGQRGYVITGQPAFLEPYETARAHVAEQLDGLDELFVGEPTQIARLERLRVHVNAKLADLERSIEARRGVGAEAAIAIVSTGRGRRIMDEIRAVEREMIREEARDLEARVSASMEATTRTEVLVAVLFLGLVIILGKAAYVTRRQGVIRRALLADLEAHTARQQAVFDSTLDGIVTLDPDGRIGTSNRAAQAMFGYAAAELKGGDLALLLDSAEGGGSAFPTDLRSPPGLSNGVIKELTAHRRDGAAFPADVALAQMQLPDGMHVVAAIRDISERRRVERLKNEFVSTVSHELRTPLTSIAGSLGLLAGGAAGPLPERAGRLVSIASSNCQRLVRLINDILDIEKIESGQMRFEMRSQSLRSLAERALEGLKGYADELGVTLRLKDRCDGTVDGDADRLLQVLTNLISNAAKFSPRGGEVEVRVRILEGGTARLSVRDEGPGVPESFHDQIFSKFAQADSSDTRQKGGTGLGLAIAKEIVERHGGRLGFESTPGSGATFFVDLPLTGRNDDFADDPLGFFRPCKIDNEAWRARRRVKILHLEPDHSFVEAACLTLSGLGEVVSAQNLAQARQLLDALAPDIVILDLDLPDGSGLELLAELQQRGPQCPPIVLYSAHGGDSTLEANVAAVLTKSGNSLPQLSATVQRLLQPLAA